MLNYKELFEILGYNNITSNSPESAVVEALGHLNYSDADKAEAIRFLKGQGWMGGNAAVAPATTEPVVRPVVATAEIPAATPPVIPEAPLASAAKPAVTDFPTVTDTAMPSKRNGYLWPVLITLFLLAILTFGGLMYARTQRIWPFSAAKYTESNLLSGLLKKSDQISAASYVFSINMDVADRDADAKPFELDEASNAAQIRRQYENDTKRIDDAGAIIRRLNELRGYDSYSYSYGADAQPEASLSYPGSIGAIFDDIESGGTNYNYYYYKDASVKDPATGKYYDYRVTDSGSNFQLTVTFETNEAVEAVRDSDYDYYYDDEPNEQGSNATIISGKTVIFTRDSSKYIYMSNEPPKPFFESLSESLRMISPETKISAAISAATETAQEDTLPDWKFNANAEGDFGDLTYKVNVDALKKGEDYYVKINNFPSFFFFDIGAFKAKWVRISPDELDDSEDDGWSMFSSLKENMAEMENDFKESRKKSVKFTKKMVEIADEENLISFKEKPKTETVEGRRLVRYDLKINKDAILPFYDRLQKAIDSDSDFEDYADSIDQGFIDYLKSDEFDQVFDYFEANNHFILWTDADGFPAAMENNLRVVPPDTATQLAEKQINIVLGWTIDDINEDLEIEAPKDSVPIDKVIEDYEKNLELSSDESVPVSSSEVGVLTKLIGSMRANIGYFFKP